MNDVLAVLELADVAAVFDSAESLLQSAMIKLEENFRSVLIRNSLPLDGERLLRSTTQVLPSSSAHDSAEISRDDIGSSGVGEPESSGGGFVQEEGTSLEDTTIVELIRSNAVRHLREIAKMMMKSGYDKECCQIYTSLPKDALDDSLTKIKVEKVSIEDVQKMDWNHLEDKMKKWSEAVKTFVNVILFKEKNLCRDVFDGSESIQQTCFTEISNRCVMQLLNFADAVAIAKKSSEKFNKIFKIYGVLYNATPQIEELFNDETSKTVRLQASNVLKALGEAAMGTLSVFEKQLQGENSSNSKTKTVQGYDIHTFTTYVTNHVNILLDHRSALTKLFEKYEDGNVDGEEMSLIGKRLLQLTSYLEKDLQEKVREQ